MSEKRLTARELLQQIHPLTDNQLLDARDQAIAVTLRDIGDPPERANFEKYAVSRAPRAVVVLIILVLATAALAAFALSIFRVFSAGRDLFLLHITDQSQATIAGLATFLLAEMLVVGSLLARSVYFTGVSKRAMTFTALIGVVIAVCGNLVISNPPGFEIGWLYLRFAGDITIWGFLFAWLDALAPPVAVLLISLAFEQMAVKRMEQHQEIERQYQQALNDWKASTADPEQHELFKNKYFPRALKTAIRDANGRGSGRGAGERMNIMDNLRPEHWNILVNRELRAADWYKPIDINAVADQEISITQGGDEQTITPFGNTAPGQAAAVNGRMTAPVSVPGGTGTERNN